MLTATFREHSVIAFRREESGEGGVHEGNTSASDTKVTDS